MHMSQDHPNTKLSAATLGGGCFWCLEAVYDQLNGVEEVVSGYAGGNVPNPSYRQVCTGTTGHAEVVQITFDPQVISFREILKVFFDIHDPTTVNRQGADVGTQYRSIILYHDEEQKAVPLETFYRAEDYHQEYFAQHGAQPYCRAVIAPKVQKLHKLYLAKLKPA
jgi:peptide-methionine (S)-S-oxide reductase